MKLSQKEIKELINNCQDIVEKTYHHHLKDDYFRRGFLLATTEISKLFIKALSRYDITIMNKGNL